MPYLIFTGCLLTALLIVRLSIGNTAQSRIEDWFSQTIGQRDVQADICHIIQNVEERLLLVADGIGTGEKGRTAAQLAVDTVARHFEIAGTGQNPVYFLKNSFQAAHASILRHIPDGTAGACLLAVLIANDQLQYGLVGNGTLFVLRKGKLHTISVGQTINTLAKEAFRQKKISREEALEVIQDGKAYNFLGKDGFQQPEVIDVPIKLHSGDLILLCTDGVTDALGTKEITDSLKAKGTCKDKCQRLLSSIEHKKLPAQDNASVVLARIRG